ncbi:MAG: class I SAM-dependent methyltransferase [Sphingomonadaceae bacterium]
MEEPFDRALRRLRRDRAAASPRAADYLHRRAGEELLARLDLVKRDFGEALVIGAPGGWFHEVLRGRGMRVAAADPAFRHARGTSGVQCDEDRLPFADGAFDLVVALDTLASVNDLPGALVLVRRVLRPDALFLAAFAGGDSLPLMRAAMLAADAAKGGAAPHVHPRIDIRAAGDLLGRAGFALPVADSDNVSVRFAELAALVDDLRAMGATNILRQRDRRPVGKAGLAAARASFDAAREADGKASERFELLYLTAWAPGPGQPTPAPRGSATASLAEALGRRR